MKLPCSSESFRPERSGSCGFAAPPSTLLALALGVFRSGPRLANTGIGETSSLELQLSFRDPEQAPPLIARAETHAVQAPPMGFSAPTAFKNRRVGLLSGFHTRRLPPAAFFRPLRASSSSIPAALFHAADALGVLSLFRAFPLRTALPGSSPSDTLSTFLSHDVRASEDPLLSCEPRPQGVLPSGSPCLDARLLQPAEGRCSLEVLSSSRRSSPLVWARLSAPSAPDLLDGGLHADPRRRSPASSHHGAGVSCSHKRQPS